MLHDSSEVHVSNQDHKGDGDDQLDSKAQVNTHCGVDAPTNLRTEVGNDSESTGDR